MPDLGLGRAKFVLLDEILDEWPEIFNVIRKILEGKKLRKEDELWLNGLSDATGWDVEDIIEEFKNIEADPSERAKRYRELFEKYLNEAVDRVKRGDNLQAGEKIWAAVLALFKFYAATIGVPIVHWSRGKVESFITNNVRAEYRGLFRELLDKASVFHENFYEGHLDDKTFRERWSETLRLFRKVEQIIIGDLKSHV